MRKPQKLMVIFTLQLLLCCGELFWDSQESMEFDELQKLKYDSLKGSKKCSKIGDVSS
jgi:hypothetical protein